jgi:hypothetical protein
MFSRDHRNLFGIGYLENNSSAYKLFDTQAFMIASYLRAQRDRDASAARFDQLIQRDQPDLSGGIRFVDSPRHQVYIDAHSFKTYLKKLRARMGWNELSEAFYDRVKVAPSAAAPGPQAPVREVVSHG